MLKPRHVARFEVRWWIAHHHLHIFVRGLNCDVVSLQSIPLQEMVAA